MLSIVKVEIDDSDQSDMDLLEERREEEIDVTEEPIRAMNRRYAQNNVFDKLQQIPIVYTTRLEDMPALQYTTFPIPGPRVVAERILKQSKPKLGTLPIKKPRRFRKRFDAMIAYLQEINKNSEKNIEDNVALAEAEPSEEIKEELPDIPTKQIEPEPVKSNMLNESSSKNTNPKDTCKYSHLLKQCKPCSVVLPRAGASVGRQPSDAVIHGGQLLKVNKVQKHILPGSKLPTSKLPMSKLPTSKLPTLLKDMSSDEEQPLITLKPEMFNLRNTTKEISADRIAGNNSAENEKVSNQLPNVPVRKDAANFDPRFYGNGVLEFVDRFSKEYFMYYVDNDSNLLDYFKDSDNRAYLYKNKHNNCPRRVLYNCCWVKKDEALQSLYPKMLMFPNSRFIRNPHPCKPGACICCCRKKENIEKPNLTTPDYTSASSTTPHKTLDNEDMEEDLEDKIQKSIININKTPQLNSSEWLRRLLAPKSYVTIKNQSQKNLIGRALTFTRPPPKEAKENRRLVTVKKGESQNSVLILRNFAIDVTEIYEINSSSNIETSITTPCYYNFTEPNVKKLLQNPDAIDITVCCWYKRDTVISSLQHKKSLLSSATIKFLRTKHTCPTNECTCCCKPYKYKKYKLKDITISSRRDGSTRVDSMKSAQDYQPQLISSFSLADSQSTQFQLGPPPLTPLSSQTSTSQDDDCQITSVITNPSLQPIPQNPTVPPVPTVLNVPTLVTIPAAPTNIMVPVNIVDSEEMSQEVNSLITSILDRFKDVRLTINSEGKVAAALNTPVNTLTTVELKVLANILSFAQSQVNVLGAKSNLNSGMSLSNIINLRVDDVQNSTLDPKVVYNEFGKNDNVNSTTQGRTQPINTNYELTSQPIPLTPPQTYAFFSKFTSLRNQHLSEAFSSFLTTKIHPEPLTETTTPVIESVFSLNPDETESSSNNVWYKQPAAQPGVSILSENTVKTYSNNSQKRKDTGPSNSNPKKIKVISPSKLDGTATNVSENTSIHNSMHQAVAVGGYLPVVPLLSNNNFHIINSCQAQPSFNCTPPTISQPMLIINPLNTSNLTDSSTVSVPFTHNSLKVQNVSSISHTQSKIPIRVSTTTETESTNVPATQTITSAATGPELPEGTGGGSVNNDLDDNNCVTTSVDLDLETKLEYSDEDLEEETEHNGPEVDNCKEEVCILGF